MRIRIEKIRDELPEKELNKQWPPRRKVLFSVRDVKMLSRCIVKFHLRLLTSRAAPKILSALPRCISYRDEQPSLLTLAS